jgi:hypothetical protein
MFAQKAKIFCPRISANLREWKSKISEDSRRFADDLFGFGLSELGLAR